MRTVYDFEAQQINGQSVALSRSLRVLNALIPAVLKRIRSEKSLPLNFFKVVGGRHLIICF